MRPLLALSAAFLVVCSAAAAFAQTFPRPYDGFQAGEDAARFNNERRLMAVNEQLGTVDFYRRWAGTTQYLGHGAWRRDVPVDPWGAPLGPYDPFGPGYGYSPLVPPSLSWTETVRQPVGRVEVQTGPNRWESHPVYEQPPQLPGPLPLYRETAPAPPTPLLPRGPREF